MPHEKLARALGAKIRRDMLKSMTQGEISVHDAAEMFDIGEVNSSKHLKKLYDLGLLDTRTDGRSRYYSLKIKEIGELLKWYDKVVKIMGEVK